MSTKSSLLKKIQAYDFAIIDIELYLDTHPENKKALKLRNSYIEERDSLIAEYEKRVGPYVVTTNDLRDNVRWSWINDPWPWEREAN